MVHVFQMFTWLPAAKVAINSVGRWVRTVLPRLEEERSRRCAQDVGDGVDGEMDSPVTRTIREKRSGLNRTVGRTNGFGVARAKASEQRRRATAFNSLHLDVDDPMDDRPTVDIDSLPASSSRSGSPTPTASPISPTTAEPTSLPPTHAPQLRRALTAAATYHDTSAGSSPANSPPGPSNRLRARRRTQGAASLHAASHSASTSTSNPSNPVSPSPSIRMRLRSPSSASTAQPSTRHRSQSHSDIFHLVEGYVDGGAANETVVYAPGGEVRSVGVLGEDEEDSD